MSKRVVIVDDSAFVRKQLKRFFEEDLGYTVVGTGINGAEAIELYDKHKPDLMTLDIVMGGMDGIDAVKSIIPKHPDAKIMMVSAVRTGEMLECISSGAKGYVEKPLKMKDPEYVKDFKDTINEILED